MGRGVFYFWGGGPEGGVGDILKRTPLDGPTYGLVGLSDNGFILRRVNFCHLNLTPDTSTHGPPGGLVCNIIP